MNSKSDSVLKMTGFRAKRPNNRVFRALNSMITLHWFFKEFDRRTEFAKRNIWSRLDRSKYSTRFGRTTLKLCMNFAVQGSQVVYFTTQKTGSTWWKQSLSENLRKCEKCFPATISIWRVILIVWLSGFMVYIKFSGETETKRCRWNSSQSWEIFLKTTQLESDTISRVPPKGEPS